MTCSICKDSRGGVPGNGNVIDGKEVCDYCHAILPNIFTKDEVVRLNEYQAAGLMHPFTCPNHDDDNHKGSIGGEAFDAFAFGTLVATVRGWVCPYCSYTQTWAHKFMREFDASKQNEVISRLTSQAKEGI